MLHKKLLFNKAIESPLGVIYPKPPPETIGFKKGPEIFKVVYLIDLKK